MHVGSLNFEAISSRFTGIKQQAVRRDIMRSINLRVSPMPHQNSLLGNANLDCEILYGISQRLKTVSGLLFEQPNSISSMALPSREFFAKSK
jgi:hypothetical protein